MHTTCLKSKDNAKSNASDHIFVIRESRALSIESDVLCHRGKTDCTSLGLFNCLTLTWSETELNRLMTKPTKWYVLPAKTQISLGIRPVWTESSLSAWWNMKKHWSLNYQWSAKWRLWSDWADAEADLSLRWAHSHFVGFVMRRLNSSSSAWCHLPGYLGMQLHLINDTIPWANSPRLAIDPHPGGNFEPYDFLKLQYISHKMRPVSPLRVEALSCNNNITYVPINSRISFGTNTKVSFFHTYGTFISYLYHYFNSGKHLWLLNEYRHLLLSVTYVMFKYCDIKNWLFIPCEKEMNVKCCLLKLKYQISHSDLHKIMLKH